MSERIAGEPEKSVWCCPSCHRSLTQTVSALECAACASKYEVVGGVPDLRFPPATDSSASADRALAMTLLADMDGKSATDIVRRFFAVREGVDGWNSRDTDGRTRASLDLPRRLQSEITGWLDDLTSQPTFLDLGCGLGGLLLAAHSAGKHGIGIDNRLSVLVIAKRLIELAGGTPVLACANAESLPLRDSSIGGVIMYDVVEHVENLPTALAEVSRATIPGGLFACSTPNRFSIAPEPHVRLLGVGWMPRKFQARYVRMRIGWDYTGTKLVSPAELVRMMREGTDFSVRVTIPLIPASDIEKGRGARHLLGRLYNLAADQAVFQGILKFVGPFFRLEGTKQAARSN